MNSDDKAITPFRAYSLEETAQLVGIHPVVLRRKLQKTNQDADPFIQKTNPQKIGREWRFMGENILRALGSVTFQNGNPQSENHVIDTSGVAPYQK